MTKLLSANFIRLWKSKLFWIAEAIMVVIPVLSVINFYIENHKYTDIEPEYAEDLLFANGVFIFFIIAVFIGIFIGTEYSDGTVRNKLIVGHTRSAIYLSNLIVCSVFSVIAQFSYMAAVLGLGLPLLGSSGVSLKLLVKYSVYDFAAIIAVTAIILLVSMLIQNKSTASVLAIILTIICLFGAMTVIFKLEEPEFYSTGYTYDGVIVQSLEGKPNPNYLSGTKRTVYQYINDISPYCQIINISGYTDLNPFCLLYSFAVIIVFTGVGIIIFRKEDLR